jgi:virginiamycin A acetyltransferase
MIETDEYLLFESSDQLVNALRKSRIHHPIHGRVAFCKKASIESYVQFVEGGPIVSMGAFSYTYSHMPLGIQVGRYCSIARGLSVFGFQHPTDRLSTSPFVYGPRMPHLMDAIADAGVAISSPPGAAQKPLPVIENDVWIGQDVTLACGITIGTGAIIAAGAVITKSVEPYAIVGGNPARMIRRRFSDALCERLLASRWWQYKFTDFLLWNTADPLAFLDAFERTQLELFEPEALTAARLRDICCS